MTNSATAPAPIEGLQLERLEESQSHRTYRATIPADEYEKSIRRELGKIRREVTIRGFRKGKAPWAVVESRHGDQAGEEAVKWLLDRACRQCIVQFNLTPVSPVRARTETDTRGGPLVGRVEVSIHHDLGRIDFEGIEVTGESTPVTEQEMTEVLEKIRYESAPLGPVGDKGLADGDVVEGDMEETELDESGEPRHRTSPRVVPGIRLGIGENHYHPALHEALQGARAGDTVTANVRFDARIPDRERAGRSFRTRFTVKQALTPMPRPTDDDFARSIGQDSLLALRGDIRDRLRAQHEARDQRELDGRILDALRKKNPVEAPPGVVEEGVEGEILRIASDLAHSGQNLLDDKESMEKLIPAVRERVTADLAFGILLDTLADQEGIKVPPEELRAALAAAKQAEGEAEVSTTRVEILLRRAAARKFLRERVTIRQDAS